MSNLLPETEKKAIVRLYRLRFVSVALYVLVFLVLSGAILLFPSLYFEKTTENILLAKKNSFAGRETSGLQGSLTTALNDINTRLNVFADPAPASPLVQSFLDPILSAKTTSIRITDFSYATGEKKNTTADIRISGVAANREALLKFADTLGKINGVTNVIVPITSFLKNADVLFTVGATITLK